MGGGSAFPPSHNRGEVFKAPPACSYVAFVIKNDSDEDIRNIEQITWDLYDQLMDPLSLTASIIAVVGLATTTTKALTKIIKSFHHSPGEIHALNNELADLQAILIALEETMTEKNVEPKPGKENCSGPSAVLKTHLQNATKALEELDRLLASGLQKQNRSQLQFWWVRNKSHAIALQREVHNTRTNLQTSLCMVNYATSSRVELIVKEILLGQQQISQGDTITLTSLYNQTTTNILESTETKIQTDTVAVRTSQASESSNQNGGRACQKWCSCVCHKKNYLKISTPLKLILGSLFIGYSGFPVNTPACNQKSCKRRSIPSLDLTYYFPTWFLTRCIISSLKFIPLAGPELVLRMPRLITWTTPEADLFHLAKAGNTCGIQNLFSEGRVSPFDVTLSLGESALLFATTFGHFDTCKFLLDNGADKFLANKHQIAPIDIAWQWIFSGRLDKQSTRKAKELFDDDSFFETMELTVIHKIVLDVIQFKRNIEEELQVSTADINVVDRSGRSPLAWAAIRGDVATLTTLLKYGAQTYSPDKSGNHPIHHAVKSGSADCIRVLLAYGAALYSQNAVGHTPLHIAASENKVECIGILISAGNAGSSDGCVDLNRSHIVNAGDHEMETPLMYAARNEHVEAATILLENSADINAKTIWGLTAVDLCIRYNCHRMLDFLLFQYDDGNDGYRMYSYASREIHEQGILHQAAKYGNTAVIKLLIRVHETGKALLDIDHKDCFGKTAMDYALQRGDQQICDLLGAFCGCL